VGKVKVEIKMCREGIIEEKEIEMAMNLFVVFKVVEHAYVAVRGCTEGETDGNESSGDRE
jgi:hypothetical protein